MREFKRVCQDHRHECLSVTDCPFSIPVNTKSSVCSKPFNHNELLTMFWTLWICAVWEKDKVKYVVCHFYRSALKNALVSNWLHQMCVWLMTNGALIKVHLNKTNYITKHCQVMRQTQYFFQCFVPCLTPDCPFLTCRAHVVSVGYLLQGYILDVKGLWWVVLLLRVNHTWELGMRAHCPPSTLPLETNNVRYDWAKTNRATWNRCMLLQSHWVVVGGVVGEQFCSPHRCETNMWAQFKF